MERLRSATRTGIKRTLYTEHFPSSSQSLIVGWLDRNIKRIVEPTNYESIKDQVVTGETLKSQAILATLDKAQRLGARSVVIAKGFPEQTFNELKNIAESRRVTLLSDTNYKDALFRIFCDDLLEAYSRGRSPSPFVYWSPSP